MATRTEYEFLVRMGAQMDKSITSTASKVTKTIAGIFGAKAIISGAKKLAGYVYQVGTESVDLASALEASVVNAANVFGGTAAQVEANEKEIQSFARTLAYDMPYSAKETADSLYYLGLAGVDLSNSMETVGDMMKLAYVAGEDVSTVVDLVTDSMSALGMEINGRNTIEYLNEVATVMATTNTNATMAMETILKFGGAAGAVGLSLEESIAMLGAMANYGVKAEEAGTLLNSALVRMTSNSTAQKAYAAAGIQLYDENGNFEGAIDVLEQLNEKRKTWNDQQSDAYFADIFGTRAYSRMLYMLDALEKGKDGISDYEEILKGIEESDGRLNRMYLNQADTYAARVEILKGQVDEMKTEVGYALIPAVEQAMGWVQERFFPDMQEGAQGLAGIISTQITPNVTAFLDSAYDKVTGMIAGGKEFLESTRWEELKESVGNIFGNIGDALINADWEMIGNTAKSFAEDAIDLAASAADLADAITEIGASPAVQLISQAFGIAGDALDALTGNGEDRSSNSTWANSVTEKLDEFNQKLESNFSKRQSTDFSLSGLFHRNSADEFEEYNAQLETAQGLYDDLQQKCDSLRKAMEQTDDPALIKGYRDSLNQLVQQIVTVYGGLQQIKNTMSRYGYSTAGANSTRKYGSQTATAFASGGIVTEPTLGLIGEAGENEAVIPLSKIGQVMRSMGGNGGGNITYAPVFQISGRADAETIKAAARDAYAEFKANYARLQKETARRAF